MMPLENDEAPSHSDATTDPNAAGREFALTMSEDELYQRTRGLYAPFLAYPPDRPMVFVKFGGPAKEAEGDMQRLAFEYLRQERQRDPSCNIHVPEVFKVFTKDGVTFIIMQLLLAAQVGDFAKTFDPLTWESNQALYYGMIADGVRLLSRMPVPPDATPGPYTTCSAKRLINHMLFKDQEAPVVYDTVEDLENHLNRVAQRAYHGPNRPKLTLEKELVYCYTDFNGENFMFTTDPDGRPRLYIVDFQHASFLPLSFLAYAVLTNKRWSTSNWIEKELGPSLPRHNIEVMKRICYIFQISWTGVGLREV